MFITFLNGVSGHPSAYCFREVEDEAGSYILSNGIVLAAELNGFKSILFLRSSLFLTQADFVGSWLVELLFHNSRNSCL